jgi:hypothetical protein
MQFQPRNDRGRKRGHPLEWLPYDKAAEYIKREKLDPKLTRILLALLKRVS